MDKRTPGAEIVSEREAALSGAATSAPNTAERGSQRCPLLSLRNVRKSYKSPNGEIVEVLKGINLEIKAGSFNVIRGESGSGKTSLLRILGMLDSAFGGEYLFGDVNIAAKPDWYCDELRSNNIGFIFQDGQLLSHLRIRENIILPVRLQGTAEDRRRVHGDVEALAPKFFTGKERRDNILSSKPSRVSGGQKQRAAIMRSVINRPAIILADEPTASLDESRKMEILERLLALREEGHTIIVVSHDKVFYNTGRQLELSMGVLREIAPDTGGSFAGTAVRPASKGLPILYGWVPRAPLSILMGQAIRETFTRLIFLFMVLTALCVGVCQIAVFSSVIIGAQAFLDDAMTKGSRLNRLEVKPRTGDLDKADRFPAVGAIRTWNSISSIVPRRATIIRVYGPDGEDTRYSAMGLLNDDPEYNLLTFVAGGRFNPSNEELEVIVTAGLLSDLFPDTAGLSDGSKHYSDFIGRPITIGVPQFAATGQELDARLRKIQLKIAGIILYGEGGRQLYMPNRTQLVFDRYKMDREGSVVLPVNEAGDAWTEDRSKIEELASFPWEDQLHVYTKEIRGIIPVFQQLSQLGYKPQTDIWKYKWVLDVRDLAWNIFVPLLVLIIVAVGLTVATNLFASAKLREREFALWRILGMRRGDLVFTQVISTILMAIAGAGLGLAASKMLIDWARSFLASQTMDGGPEKALGLEKVFAPLDEFYVPILISAVAVGILSAIYPAVKTARADPARVLQS
jgi:ABC-type lipoprotein export system ATPase subunit